MAIPVAYSYDPDPLSALYYDHFYPTRMTMTFLGPCIPLKRTP